MATVATPAMRQFAADWEAAIDTAAKRDDAATLSGIVGDAAHRIDGGYHISREDQPAGNYSVQVPEDRGGASSWASAVDMSMNPPQMATVTARLLASAKDPSDPRLNYCREFYGTLNGRDVIGWDTYYGTAQTADSTHLWHVHISFLRQYAGDAAAMAAVLSVITGQPYQGDDMEQTDRLLAKTANPVRAVGDVLGDLSNLRDWLIGETKSPTGPTGSPVPPTSPLGKLLAAAENPPPPTTASAANIAAEIIRQLKA